MEIQSCELQPYSTLRTPIYGRFGKTATGRELNATHPNLMNLEAKQQAVKSVYIFPDWKSQRFQGERKCP